MDDYDVFLNHRGPDVKAGFMSHLEEALRQAGLNPFLDKSSLRQGNNAFRGIDAALKVARVQVAVVSRRYAESKYCLSELVVMLGSGRPVIPVLYDVEPWELRGVDKGAFAAAFEKHRWREASERVQEWANALCKLADITAFVFRSSDYEGNEAELKQKVVNAVLSSLPVRDTLQVERHLVGLEEQMKTCVNELKKMSGAVGILGLVGMGGIGKTSLAKVICNDLIGWKKFQGMSFLEIGRNSPSSMEVGSSLLKRMQKQLLWDLLHIAETNQVGSYGYWFPKLSKRGPVLIVMDDVQDKDQFDNLILSIDALGRGSCIIVTSRDHHLVKLIAGRSSFYLHVVMPLDGEDSQKLFNRHAFGDEKAPDNFEALASDVSKACGGLPLALKVVGSSLFGRTSDKARKCIWLEAIEALKGNRGIMNALKWSYECLPESEKLMFVDIACVFCGWREKEALEIWRSCKKCSSCCGNGAPHTSLENLVDKSLVVVDSDNVLTMHGLLRDMGQGIAEVVGSHLWEGMAMKLDDNRSRNWNKVRAVNLANSGRQSFEAENFAKMQNLHYLILDGCDVRGNLGSISKELRYLQWRHMPVAHVPPMLNLSNLISLDFSSSTNLANSWLESEAGLEGCPNLLRLNLGRCTSITTLPDSIGRLSRLRVLKLHGCRKLQKLPDSIGQLTSLEDLDLILCKNLEALPDSIGALSGLRQLYLSHGIKCTSNLRATIGLLTNLSKLIINLGTERHVDVISQLNALKAVMLSDCIDDAISVVDSLGTFRNLHRLWFLEFISCPSMTKLPESIGLLSNLKILELWECGRIRELPDSIGQLKGLRKLSLGYCSSLETLPDSLGALTSLQELWIVECTSLIRLPRSRGHLSGLRKLGIQGSHALQFLPDSLRHLNSLVLLQIMDCGRSLEGLGLLRALQGLRIWGCTSISKLPGSCLVVVDSSFMIPASIFVPGICRIVPRNVKEVEVVEASDCGFLRNVRDAESGRVFLQRVHNGPCETLNPVRKNERLGSQARLLCPSPVLIEEIL